ncbi:MAG: COX15/CtaA family protein [Burkholderiales bacterium]
MDPQTLYDLSPAVRLMLVGLLVASLPLAWLALRHRAAGGPKRVQVLTLLTLFLTFDLVLFGAFTRLTDSGLGCPDWPGCYGNASPIGASHEIAMAQSVMPSGPVTHGKAWVEMIHRYLASGVGVLIIALLALAWWQRRQTRRTGQFKAPAPGLAWPLATLVWVCLQGAFGALTVTMKLFPAIVTLHLIGGLVLLALLAVQASRQSLMAQGAEPALLPSPLRTLLWAAFSLVALQVALGGWVSTNYAVLACDTFPKCQGQWWPPMNFEQALQVWRPLGHTADGALLGFPALTAIHMSHRLMALVVLLVLGLLAWRLWRFAALRRHAKWIAALALWQLASGLSNVLLGWPLAAAVAHTGGAAALIVVLTWALVASGAVSETKAQQTRMHRPAQARVPS